MPFFLLKLGDKLMDSSLTCIRTLPSVDAHVGNKGSVRGKMAQQGAARDPDHLLTLIRETICTSKDMSRHLFLCVLALLISV